MLSDCPLDMFARPGPYICGVKYEPLVSGGEPGVRRQASGVRMEF